MILAGWYIAECLANTPDEIAYFNSIVGAASEKHKYLISSNLDWGQAMKPAATYLKEHASEQVYVAYEHPAPYPLPADVYLPPHPDSVAITAPFHPAAGLYVIGATNLEIPSSCCGLGLDSYAYLRNSTPVDTIGDGAILVYSLTEATAPTWLVQCGTLTPPLDATTIERGFEHPDDIRKITVDCTHAWVQPTGSGVVALATRGDEIGDPFVQARLNGTRLSYEQPAGFIPEPFVLYESVASPAPDLLPGARAADATTAPLALPANTVDEASYAAGLTLLGVSLLSSGDDTKVDAMTWWQVTGPAPAEPLSIMAHLVDPSGNTLGNADGLDVMLSTLQPGDLFAQRHTFALPDGVDPRDLWVRVGLYRLGDLTRLRIVGTDHADAVFVPLADDHR